MDNLPEKIKKKVNRLKENGGNTDVAQLDVLIEATDKLDKVVEAIKDIPKTEIPAFPDFPEQKEVDLKETNKVLADIVNELKKEKDNVLKLPLDVEVVTLKGNKGDKGDSIKGDKGEPGYTPIKGVDYFDGKDGSPDTADEIAEKLNTLDGKIERKVIKGLEKMVEKETLDRAISILDQRTQFLINKQTTSTAVGGGGTWGSITGTLSDQTDLKAALDAKIDTLGAIGATPNANGATITGTTLNLEPANIVLGTPYGGVVSTGTQTFVGEKTIFNQTANDAFSASLQVSQEIINTGNRTGDTHLGSYSKVTITDDFNHTTETDAGNLGEVIIDGDGTISGSLVGSYGQFTLNGVGTVDYGIGNGGTVSNNSTGTITTAIGSNVDIENTGGGTITDAVAFNVGALAGTNKYGFVANIDGTNNILRQVTGNTASGGTLTLMSTTHATKGKILFGTSAYDEVNNRLGISTTTPATNLVINRSNGITTIQGGSANDSTLLLRVNTDGATGNAIEFQYGSSGNYLGSRIVSEIVSGGGADLFFQTGTNGAGTYTSKLTIKRDGNVGVGVTSPGAKFTVEDTNKTIGTTSADVNAAIHTTTSQAADVGGTIALGGLTDNSGNRRNLGIIAGRKTNGTNANTSGYLSFSTNNGTSMVERMRILDTGNVGIGVTAPTAVLHLKAGTASASTAPLKFTSGTNLTTAEAGAFEYNGSSLMFTPTGTLRSGVLMTDNTNYNTYTQLLKGATAFTTGNGNTLIGFESGAAMTTAVYNVAIGHRAGYTGNSTGFNSNVFIGREAGATSGSSMLHSILMGYQAGNSSNAGYSIGIGYQAIANTGVLDRINGIGYLAGNGATNGNYSMFCGASAGYQATGASYVFFGGQEAGYQASASPRSVFVGQQAGYGATTAPDSVFLGDRAGRNATGAGFSIIIGKDAGYNSTGSGITGDYNILLGYQAGDNITTGAENVLIGRSIDAQSATASGQLSIQNAIFGTGNTGTGTTASTGYIGIYTVAPTCALDVTGGIATSRTTVTSPASTDGNIFSGTYTPTLTGVTNVTSSTAYACQYMRVGNLVTVSGKVEVTATANNTQTTIGISLPIASNFANSQECGGSAHTVANTVAGHGAAIYGDATNNRAEMDYYETHGASDTFSFTFTYQII